MQNRLICVGLGLAFSRGGRGTGVRCLYGFGVSSVLDFRCLYGFDCYNSVTILLHLTVDYLLE